MNTTNSKIRLFLNRLLLCVTIGNPILFFSACQNSSQLSIVSTELCDNFDNRANCTEPKEKVGIVYLNPTTSKKELQSWESFANYLYFTARETPGFLVTFSRNLSPKEQSELRIGYKAYITLDGVREKMEGFDVADNHIASFHYLGALLKEVKRNQKVAGHKTDLDTLGPLLLQFEYVLPSGQTGSIQREILLRWKNETPLFLK